MLLALQKSQTIHTRQHKNSPLSQNPVPNVETLNKTFSCTHLWKVNENLIWCMKFASWIINISLEHDLIAQSIHYHTIPHREYWGKREPDTWWRAIRVTFVWCSQQHLAVMWIRPRHWRWDSERRETECPTEREPVRCLCVSRTSAWLCACACVYRQKVSQSNMLNSGSGAFHSK